MKLVYITPHLSTGGMPEYLRKKIELLKNDFDIWVLELNYEPNYNSIRNKIVDLIGERLINCDSNFEKMWNEIENINPDVIHFEEISDYYYSDWLLSRIYDKNRSWKIFETLHDSSIDHQEKRWIPDKMIVVSPWQIKNFLHLNIPIEIIEHDIEPGIRNRQEGLLELGLNPDKKHVLQVGIFSSRKNQSETFQIAEQMPDVEFHFVGPITDNYKSYWENLLKTKPDNVKVWGERSDVYNFYKCVDVVIFPSRGRYGDMETNPLVIRESIYWGIPLLLRKLPVYMGIYDNIKGVYDMSDYLEQNVNLLYKILDMKNEKNKIKMQENFFKKKLFNITFNQEDNKINFDYLEDLKFETKVCIRDIDTEVTIYSFEATFENKSGVWAIPIPKQYYNFNDNPNFGGFMYDFYDTNGNRVYTQTTRIKPTAFQKKKFRIESFEPLFVNYEQFFTDKIYDKFLKDIKLDLVLDVGCNIGLFTQLVTELGANKVYCFDVSKEAIGVFNKIHDKNKQIEIFEVAISDKKDKITFYEDLNNSLITSANNSYINNWNKIEVDSDTLDNIFNYKKIESVSLMKMDIEGSEYSAFDGLSDKNLSKIESIILEFHHNFAGILIDKIINRLKNNNFDVTIYQDDCKNFASEWEERGTIFAKKLI
jgi:FkbM family methyltransferase